MSFEVIVIVYRSRVALGGFLEKLPPELPVTVVDNSYGEHDISDLLAGRPGTRHIDSGGNLGYSAAANLGARLTEAEFLIFMNPDTRPTGETLRQLVEHLERNPDVACCGAAGEGTSGGGAEPGFFSLLISALALHRVFPLSSVFHYPARGQTVEVGYVSGSCLAIRREVFEEVGGWDPYFYIWGSDYDLGMRLARLGHRQVVLGDVVIPHDNGLSGDVPSTWVWEHRGRAWTKLLRRHHGSLRALALCGVLAAGYGVRLVVYRLARRPNRALEMSTYLRSMVGEWVRPEPR